jgi:hypothetical protein
VELTRSRCGLDLPRASSGAPEGSTTDYLGLLSTNRYLRPLVDQGCSSGKTLQRWAEKAVRLASPGQVRVAFSVRERIGVVGRPAMLVEKGYRAATLSDRRCPVLSVVVGCDVAPMWPQGHELEGTAERKGPSCSEAERRGQADLHEP